MLKSSKKRGEGFVYKLIVGLKKGGVYKLLPVLVSLLRNLARLLLLFGVYLVLERAGILEFVFMQKVMKSAYLYLGVSIYSVITSPKSVYELVKLIKSMDKTISSTINVGLGKTKNEIIVNATKGAGLGFFLYLVGEGSSVHDLKDLVLVVLVISYLNGLLVSKLGGVAKSIRKDLDKLYKEYNIND